MQATPAVYHKEIARTHGALKAICIAFSSRLRRTFLTAQERTNRSCNAVQLVFKIKKSGPVWARLIP